MQKKQPRDVHPFKEIQQRLQEDKIPSVLLLYGREEFLVRWAWETITSHFIAPGCQQLDCSRLDAATVTLDEIRNHCETLPMISRKRVVLLEDFKGLEGTKMKNLDEEELEQLAEYLGQLPEHCVVVFTCQKPDQRRKLFLSVKKRGQVYDMTALPRQSLEPFLLKRFRSAGKLITPQLMGLLIQESGYLEKDSDYTLYHMEHDVAKIISHSQQQEILEEDIRLNLTRSLEDNVFSLLEAAQSGNRNRSFLLLHDLFAAKTNEMLILAAISSQYELLLSMREMMDDGHPREQIRTYLGVHDYRFQKTLPIAARLDASALRSSLAAIYQVDKSIKSGLMDPDLALELLLLQL